MLPWPATDVRSPLDLTGDLALRAGRARPAVGISTRVARRPADRAAGRVQRTALSIHAALRRPVAAVRAADDARQIGAAEAVGRIDAGGEHVAARAPTYRARRVAADLAEAHVRRGTAVPLVAADVLRCAAHGPVDAVRGVWRAALTLHRVDEAHVPRTLRTAEVGRHVSTDGGTARTTDRSSRLRRIAAHLAWVRAVAERARGRVDAAVPGEDAFETRAPTTIRAVVAARAR